MNVESIRESAGGILAVQRYLPGMVRALPPLKIPAAALGAMAVGALAVGALAIGALAIGSLGIGSLSAGRGRFRSLEVEELKIGTLQVRETSETRP